MAQFIRACVILSPSYDSIEIRVQGMTKVIAGATQQPCGLYGAVTVATKNISAGEQAHSVISTYKELSQLLKEAHAYEKHLETTIKNYPTKIVDPQEAAVVIAAYRRIKDDVFTVARALYYISKGTNTYGSKVWLKTAVEPVAPQRPINPFSVIPSAPPPELLDDPPSYAEVMTEPEAPPKPPRPPMPAAAVMNAYYEANQIN